MKGSFTDPEITDSSDQLVFALAVGGNTKY